MILLDKKVKMYIYDPSFKHKKKRKKKKRHFGINISYNATKLSETGPPEAIKKQMEEEERELTDPKFFERKRPRPEEKFDIPDSKRTKIDTDQEHDKESWNQWFTKHLYGSGSYAGPFNELRGVPKNEFEAAAVKHDMYYMLLDELGEDTSYLHHNYADELLMQQMDKIINDPDLPKDAVERMKIAVGMPFFKHKAMFSRPAKDIKDEKFRNRLLEMTDHMYEYWEKNDHYVSNQEMNKFKKWFGENPDATPDEFRNALDDYHKWKHPFDKENQSEKQNSDIGDAYRTDTQQPIKKSDSKKINTNEPFNFDRGQKRKNDSSFTGDIKKFNSNQTSQ
jgi:hypothetical protein